MMLKMKGRKILALMLMLTLCLTQLTIIAEARASDYISSYSASMTAVGSGKVTVWFSITGTGTMEELGATAIYIYDASTNSLVKTYKHANTSGMLGTNKGYHSGSITYSGTAGKQYYALVYLWAGKDGGGDSRSKTTSTITAT